MTTGSSIINDINVMIRDKRKNDICHCMEKVIKVNISSNQWELENLDLTEFYIQFPCSYLI